MDFIQKCEGRLRFKYLYKIIYIYYVNIPALNESL